MAAAALSTPMLPSYDEMTQQNSYTLVLPLFVNSKPCFPNVDFDQPPTHQQFLKAYYTNKNGQNGQPSLNMNHLVPQHANRMPPSSFPVLGEETVQQSQPESFMTPNTVQQQLANLHKQIIALKAAIGSYPSSHHQHSMQFPNPSTTLGGTSLYPKYRITSLPLVNTQSCGSGPFENSQIVLTDDKFNVDNTSLGLKRFE